MTQEEIRKLLGGYATNTLTERERTVLFEAALEDQDLFDTLQNEDALRELLADPASHEQIREALRPVAAGPRQGFWEQPWLIGAGSLAAVAAIAIAIVTWHHEPVATSVPGQIAQTQIEPKLETPQPAPLTRAPARKQAAREQARPVQLAADAPLYRGPLVRYSVLRSGLSGDAVRIEVVSQVAGSLALYRADAGGRWQRIFPANGPGLPIVANAPYQIPDDPIAIRGSQKKLRLVIEPAARPAFGSQLAAGSLTEPRAQAMPKATAAPAPLVVEIPIGPN
jgi:hypothetical protein